MDKLELMATRLAALEARFAEEDCEKKEASERAVISSQITVMERKLASDSVVLADMQPLVAADEDEDDEDDEEKTASLVDQNGIEEEITQDYLTEVENLEHGVELTTGGSVLDVSPTEYVAQLRNASTRLDVVSNFMEQTGRVAEAMRIDKIADAIDTRVAKLTTKS